MELYNTLTRSIEPFALQDHSISLYVCGITPYDTTHLGHAFTYASADILVRYLEFRGLKVRYAQNVTDIDDDILRKAREVGEDWISLGNRWTVHYIRDMQDLNIRPPDYYTRATDMIPQIIDSVVALLDVGLAYHSGGSVYYDIGAWPEYGKLSLLPPEKMLPISTQRGNNPDDPHKRAPLDFVLWQAQAPGEPAWESPWGPGRPGWHIECSTIVTQQLGSTIDVHMGGDDLVFPHHESEIAQVEPVNQGNPYVRTWMHTAMVHHQGEKMSKSLGNLVMVRDLLAHFSPGGLRLYLAGYHYRQVWSYDEEALWRAEQLAHKLQVAVQAASGSGDPLDPSAEREVWVDAMEHDLDTPTSLLFLENLADAILTASRLNRNVAEAQNTLRELAQVYGVRLEGDPVEPGVIAGWDAHLRQFEQS
ncbi:MAG: cysteine--tRNA ligase [Chloroflexota bacterium]|nr:MAG: cysteine--tRNA ligase [Chloroflexota bacterium]